MATERTGGPKVSVPSGSRSVEVFFSYSHRDERLRDELEKHLSILKNQGVITSWYDRRIAPGSEGEGQIDEHLESAHVILLLVSADFLASDYCYDVELKRAMERHEAGEARVIPVILRDVDWSGAPFCKLQALPKDAKPVTSWDNADEAFADIARAIRKVVEKPSLASESPSVEAFGEPHAFEWQQSDWVPPSANLMPGARPTRGDKTVEAAEEVNSKLYDAFSLGLNSLSPLDVAGQEHDDARRFGEAVQAFRDCVGRNTIFFPEPLWAKLLGLGEELVKARWGGIAFMPKPGEEPPADRFQVHLDARYKQYERFEDGGDIAKTVHHVRTELARLIQPEHVHVQVNLGTTWPVVVDSILVEMLITADELPARWNPDGLDALESQCNSWASSLIDFANGEVAEDVKRAESLRKIADHCDELAGTLATSHSGSRPQIERLVSEIDSQVTELRKIIASEIRATDEDGQDVHYEITTAAGKAKDLARRFDTFVQGYRLDDLRSEAFEIGEAILPLTYMGVLADEDNQVVREAGRALHLLETIQPLGDGGATLQRMKDTVQDAADKLTAVVERFETVPLSR